MNSDLTIYQPSDESIVVYKSNDGIVQLEVQLANETVWLTLDQMAELFQRNKSTISRHIRNIFECGELSQDMVVAKNATTTKHGALQGKTQTHEVTFYNLDMIISIGYRVNSIRGVQFRQWASRVLKEYLLRGYSINQHLVYMERRIDHQLQEHAEQIHELQDKVDFFVRTSLPPKEGVFYNGQIFDAYVFATDLIKSAKKSITLIDNYIDESVLLMLAKRNDGVTAKIITRSISDPLKLDLDKHNKQYLPIDIQESDRYHDRFLIIDEDVYHLGASMKDLGKKLFAFSKMEIPSKILFQ
ncbi:MAG: virulence RhuM family protein [Bacteroidales bacterium]|nr:virulence RhuM family protein [Bacteroidales bacterium]